MASLKMRDMVGTLLVAVLLVAVAASAAFADEGDDSSDDGGPGVVALGYDISYPQCGAAYPAGQSFGIVGVNAGLPYSANPCLASEYQWALGSSSTTQPPASLYANTANPGPARSSHWPSGQQTPKPCDGSWSAECSYDYGWNAVEDSFRTAAAAIGPAAAGASQWWLDVETANSWNATDLATNVADVAGALDYLQTVGKVPTVGIYSTAAQWQAVTGSDSPSNSPFSTAPNWVAGAPDLNSAPGLCTASFTGGTVVYVQYPADGFDGDYPCARPDGPGE